MKVQKVSMNIRARIDITLISMRSISISTQPGELLMKQRLPEASELVAEHIEWALQQHCN